MHPNHSIPIPAPCPPATSLQMLCDGGGKESSSLSMDCMVAWIQWMSNRKGVLSRGFLLHGDAQENITNVILVML